MKQPRHKRSRYNDLLGADGAHAETYHGVVRTENHLAAKFATKGADGKPTYILFSDVMLKREVAEKGNRAHPDVLRALEDLKSGNAAVSSGKKPLASFPPAEPEKKYMEGSGAASPGIGVPAGSAPPPPASPAAVSRRLSV